MELNSTPVTVASLQTPMIPSSNVVIDDADKVGSMAPHAPSTPHGAPPLDLLTPANMNQNPMSTLSGAATSPKSMNFPLPKNLGSVDSDGAPVASRKGTIMRPKPHSITAWLVYQSNSCFLTDLI